jgi:hypothetical protein
MHRLQCAKRKAHFLWGFRRTGPMTGSRPSLQTNLKSRARTGHKTDKNDRLAAIQNGAMKVALRLSLCAATDGSAHLKQPMAELCIDNAATPGAIAKQRMPLRAQIEY